MRRELTAARHIPYTAHVSPEVVKTACGDYLQVFRLAGASFESADIDQLNVWHEKLNVLWRNVAAPGISVWSHIIRRRETPRPSGGVRTDLQPLSMRSTDVVSRAEILMVNELYLAVLYRPAAGRAAGILSGLISRLKPASPRPGNGRRSRNVSQTGAGAVRLAGAIRARKPPLLPGLRALLFIAARVSRPARQRRAAADANASWTSERGTCGNAGLLRRRGRGVSGG